MARIQTVTLDDFDPHPQRTSNNSHYREARLQQEAVFPVFCCADTFSQSSYTRWSVSLSNTVGQLTATRVYHTTPASGDGSSGTNYDESTFGYDGLGRQNKSSDVEAARMPPTGGVA